ncbi:DinB family protein [Roseisolibacter sp. H3M3-2]|uniref:DinB family protein n=1 Tax=Roseisolibacter sp. H3M3-2 TaxID=3031323 RepID=UPI0023DCBA30|nr:DinB family protein [Roseisolibacter sp. H3M3-2]MDF1502874.1 DinB family protein [Roseisolibacter sp. H3M3-2]
MHPRVSELVDHLTRGRAALLAAVAAVPADALSRAPRPGAWSPAQILEHLAKVEAGSASLLARRLARAKEAGLGPETDESSVLAAPSSFGPDRAPREAPEIVRPTGEVDAETALARLQDSRAALLAVLDDGDGLALGQVTATHAALGELDLYGWARFIADHEAHHERQIRAIADAGTPTE